MNYLSVCSGIEAATVAWHPLGWTPVAFSEIEPFPCAVLAHHYPSVPNWGDMTKFKDWPDAAIDLLVGGTPCQSFSVAGLRKGLADPRGNLALTYLAIVDRYRPKWVVWENVPGVLSATSHAAPDPCPPTDDVDEGAERVVEDEYDTDEVHAFACFLAGLSELGYGFAYGSLDAQHFNLAQRRERVFVVGHLGDWRRAAAVLFERESLSGHPAPRREAWESVAPTVSSGAPFSRTGNQRVEAEAIVPSIAKPLGALPMANAGMSVRRLTPKECCRLQGFPDTYLDITYRGKPAADGPKYKALGNSMAVPCMAWIGRRIALVDAIEQLEATA